MGSLEEEWEKEKRRVVGEILMQLPINDERKTMKFWPREVDLDSLYDFQISDVGGFRFDIKRNYHTGEILGYEEVFCAENAHSLSLARPPGAGEQNLLGSISNLPFLPGGMEDDWAETMKNLHKSTAAESTINFDEFELHSVPPGFASGIDFSKQIEERKEQTSIAKAERNAVSERADIFDILDFLTEDSTEFAFAQEPKKDSTESRKVVGVEDNRKDNEKMERELNKEDELGELLQKPLKNVGLSVNLDSATRDKMEVKKEYKYAKFVDVNQPVVDFRRKVPTLAHEYPFELDTFQKQAVLHLEAGDSVFVAAHTSAGKTAVAEYAISLCKKHLTRAIYTSPIKALSNQKFRDFKQTYDQVGLITGDIQLNTDAFCLIMTTEILRSMLLNGSEVIRELEWVIFDEVHYINDAERGVVWEEVLIFLPSHCKIIMLSATVSNTMDFADWVGQIKQRNIYVISTPKRPVPLEHFLYTGKDGKTKNNRFLAVDKNGVFNKIGYDKALASKSAEKSSGTGPKFNKSTGNNPKTDRNIWISLIDHLSTNNLLPSVVFTFSRRRCDENAAMLTSIDLTTAVEKSDIHHFFSSCISRLKGSDRKLPQVMQMQSLCKQGLAVHHSGILPIMKEAVEMLFQKGCVKVLFATETFAMGVNMPARTVVFDSTRKHDGQMFRDLKPGEYTQMAGRAGRRGLDKTGTVIIMCKKDVPEQSDLHRMILGKPDQLDSQFRVTYGLLLNLLRVEQFRVEDVLKRSFAEIASLRQMASRKERLAALNTKINEERPLKCATCVDGGLGAFYANCREALELRRRTCRRLLERRLTPGVYVTFSKDSMRNALGVVVSVEGGKLFDVLAPKYLQPDYYTESLDDETLALFDVAFGDETKLARPVLDSVEYSISSLTVDHVINVVSNKQAVKAATLKQILEDVERRKTQKSRNIERDENVNNVVREIQRLALAAEKEVAFFDVKDLQLGDVDVLELTRKLNAAKVRLRNEFPCVTCICFREHFTICHENFDLRRTRDELMFQLSEESLQLTPSYNQKLLVLQHLGYVDENKMVTLKGRVACHVNQYELLIAEMMLENLLGPLEPADIAAVLSAITCQQKIDEQLTLPDHLQKLRSTVEKFAEKICECQRKYQVADNDLSSLLRFDLMQVVYEWAKGTPFYQIMQLTTAQEGIIVKCIQRLAELCRDVRSAARLVGDPTLERKMEETSTLIKRDIVFAASLYTTM